MKRKTALATLSPLAATNGARVAIYVRVSSAMQVEDGFSLEAQLKTCQKFAADAAGRWWTSSRSPASPARTTTGRPSSA